MSPSAKQVDATFPGIPESVASARRFVAASLERFGCDPATAADGVLLVSELVAHGIEHGTPPVHVRVRMNSNGSMRLEVSDASESWQEGVGTPASGLVQRIISRLATRRGSMPWRQGQGVWFEIEPGGRFEAG